MTSSFKNSMNARDVLHKSSRSLPPLFSFNLFLFMQHACLNLICHLLFDIDDDLCPAHLRVLVFSAASSLIIRFRLKVACVRRFLSAMAKHSVSAEKCFISIADDAHYPLDALTIPACYKDDLETVMIPEGLIQDRIKQLAHQVCF